MESPSRSSARSYASALDGLRALCALGVIFYHLGFGWTQGGLHGVTVLFVLTGYLTCASLLRTYARTGEVGVGRFWARRLWRLMPTVIVFVAVTTALCAWFSPVLLTKLREDMLSAVLMFINWKKIFSNASYFNAAGQSSPVTHFWSLAVEAQFYLVWPLLLALMLKVTQRRKPLLAITLLLAAASAVAMALLYVPGEDPTRVYYGTDTRAASILIGCALALIWPLDRKVRKDASAYSPKARAALELLAPASVAALVAAMVLLDGTSDYNYYGGIVAVSLVAAVAAAALVVPGTRTERVLSFKPLAWLGKRSYALYVWHYPILELLNPLNVTTATPWWHYVLQVALVVAVAELSYRLVEQPLRNGFATPGWRGGAYVRANGFKSWALSHKAALAALVAVVPVCAYAGWGLATIEPVNAVGNNPNEQVVMHATLKKPLADGVYDVVFIGDSVSLGASEQLNAAFPHGLIDSEGSRQLDAGIETLEAYLDQGAVGQDVVISLGTNGDLTEEGLDRVVELCGDERRVWFVNVRGPYTAQYDANNAAIDACVAAHDNAYLIDWHACSEGHDEYLGPDGIHLTYTGRDAFAKLVVDTMGYEVADDVNTRYDVLIIGDALPMSVAGELAEAYPLGAVDTADGRTAAGAADALASYEEQNVVGSVVVVAVDAGTNVSADALERMVASLEEGQTLYLVNCSFAGEQCRENNEAFEAAAAAHDEVRLVDWYAASVGHSEYFLVDGVSLTEAGREAYVSLITSEVTV